MTPEYVLAAQEFSTKTNVPLSHVIQLIEKTSADRLKKEHARSRKVAEYAERRAREIRELEELAELENSSVESIPRSVQRASEDAALEERY